jgi:hypothetical protein
MLSELVSDTVMLSFILFTPDMDSEEKAALTAIAYTAAGILTKLGYMLLSMKKIYMLSELMADNKLIIETRPKNLILETG